MKALLFVSYNPLCVTNGGIHRVTALLMKEFTDRGYQCYYLINKDGKRFFINNTETSENELNLKQLRAYIECKNIGYVIDQAAIFTDTFQRAFRELGLKDVKNIAVFHNTPLIGSIVFDRQRLIEGIHVSKTLRQKASFMAMWLFYPKWKKRSDERIRQNYKFIYDNADRLVLLSDRFIKPLSAFMNQELPKCIGIPNPLTFDTIEDLNILVKKKKQVLIVSRLYNQEKRVNIALDVWKEVENCGFDDWELVIVGDGFDFQKLQEQAKYLRLRNVRFTGKTESEPYYKTASIFLLTSKVEGWGLTLTESMQNGVVPIAFDSYESLHDIITDMYDGCIIPNNDKKAYANKLIELMTNQDLRERIASNGLESCKRFTTDKVMQYWVNLIEQL